MRKLIISLILLLGLFELSRGQRCTKNFCDHVDCSTYPNKSTCRGLLLENSSQCGCCSTCINFIEDGDKCSVLFSYMEVNKSQKILNLCQPHSRCTYNKCFPLYKQL